MEYEKNRVKWYWLFLFVIWTGAAVVAVLLSNKYLYSTKVFREELAGRKLDMAKPVPSVGEQAPIDENLGEMTFVDRYSFQRTQVDPTSETWNRTWVVDERKPFLTEEDQLTEPTFVRDDSGYFLGGKGAWVAAADSEGQLRWKFGFSEKKNQTVFPPIMDQQLVYVSSSQGKIAALRKDTGRLQWMIHPGKAFLSSPILVDDHLYVVMELRQEELEQVVDSDDDLSEKKRAEEEEKKGRLVVARFNRRTGEQTGRSPRFPGAAPAEWSLSDSKNSLIAVLDSRILVFERQTLNPVWTQNLPEPNKGPAVIVGEKVFVTTRGGKVLALEIKKGRKLWETDLESPAAAPVSYVPIYESLAVTTDDGYLHTLNMEDGARVWRFNTQNESPYKGIWVMRLNGRMIEELQMKWRFKGYTIWTPCASQRVCLFNPEKGQIVGRMDTGGALLTAPFFEPGDTPSFLAFARSSGEAPGLGVQLIRYMEKSAWLRKERESAQANTEKLPPVAKRAPKKD